MKLNLDVVATETATPERIATTVTFEDDAKWIRLCEGGCGKEMAEDKIFFRPIRVFKPGSDAIDVVEVTRTAPSAGRCISCGPAPKN